jgi:hypothetical protein
MGDGIQINRVAERLCSHTQAHSRPHGFRASQHGDPVRKQLIAAMVEVVAEGGDPRLIESRALS